jgi:hypothetical protein
MLQGELGAGKTCLVQGLAMALGIDEPITSPTFALAQHYKRPVPDGRPHALIHLDLYRLEQPAAAAELFAQEEGEAPPWERCWQWSGPSGCRGCHRAPGGAATAAVSRLRAAAPEPAGTAAH